MNKAYPNKVNWQNTPSTSTPLGATNLNKMSDALDTIDDRVITLDSDKVDKETGKGLSTNDYTTAEKTKLAGISEQANKVEITPVVTEGTTLATISIDGVDTDIKGSDIDVDDEMSPTSENPVQNKIIYETLQNILPEETAEGNPISITDASGLSAKSCEVTLSPIQDLNGQSAPYPAGGGKNKFNNIATTQTINGITFTVNTDGTVTVKGTATENAIIYSSINLDAGNYLFNGARGGSSASNYNAFIWDSTENARATKWDGVTPSINGYTNFEEVKIVDGHTYTFNMRVLSGATYSQDTVLFYPMICLSTETDPTFAPYSNICPISGRNSLVLNQTGLNLCNWKWNTYTSANKLSIMLAQGDYVLSSETEMGTGYIYVKGTKKNGTTCTKAELGLPSGWAESSTAGVFYGGNTTTRRLDFSIPENGVTFECGRANQNGTINAMLNRGTERLEYVPYTGQTHTATFSDTVYGGKLDFVSGKGISSFILRKYTGANSENWSVSSLGTSTQRFTIGTSGIGTGTIISDMFTYSETAGKPFGYFRMNSDRTTLIINDGNQQFDSLSAFKTWVQSNNFYVLYPLATPTEITLTPETIELLKGNNTLWTDGDNITLKYSADIKEWVLAQLQS